MCRAMAHFMTFLVSPYLQFCLSLLIVKTQLKKKKSKYILSKLGKKRKKKEYNDNTNLGSNRFYTRKFCAARMGNPHQILIFQPLIKLAQNKSKCKV